MQDSVREDLQHRAYRVLLMVRVMAGLGNGTNEAQSVESHENGPGHNKECHNSTYSVALSNSSF